MKMKNLILATLAVALSPSLMFAAAPAKMGHQSTGTRQSGSNQYHDRTPHVHEHGSSISPR